MKVANNSAIKEYNELLSGAFRFEDEWHSYVLRCCPNRHQDRESLALDVCSNLLMLARGKLSEKISVIPSHDEMIKYFCTCAKYTCLRVMKEQRPTYLSVIGLKYATPQFGQYQFEFNELPVKDHQTTEVYYKDVLNHIFEIIDAKSKTCNGAVTNKYELAKMLMEAAQQDYDFSFSSISESINVSRSTLDNAMVELRNEIKRAAPEYKLYEARVKAYRIKQKIKKARLKARLEAQKD
jgi:predicted DNA-binding protein YlxM (UPF0122 family)